MIRCAAVVGLALILVVGLGTSAPGDETFHALGMSEETDGGPPPTVERAVRDGFVKALQDAVRGMLGFSSLEEYENPALEQLYRQPQRFILSYRVLQETTLSNGYMVLLEVTIDTDRVRTRLRQLGVLTDIPSLEEPRTLQVVVRGINEYEAYRDIEALLGNEEEGGREVTIAEMEAGRFVWNLVTTEEIRHLADRLQNTHVGGHRLVSGTVTDTMLEIEIELIDQTVGGGDRQ